MIKDTAKYAYNNVKKAGEKVGSFFSGLFGGKRKKTPAERLAEARKKYAKHAKEMAARRAVEEKLARGEAVYVGKIKIQLTPE